MNPERAGQYGSGPTQIFNDPLRARFSGPGRRIPVRLRLTGPKEPARLGGAGTGRRESRVDSLVEAAPLGRGDSEALRAPRLARQRVEQLELPAPSRVRSHHSPPLSPPRALSPSGALKLPAVGPKARRRVGYPALDEY